MDYEPKSEAATDEEATESDIGIDDVTGMGLLGDPRGSNPDVATEVTSAVKMGFYSEYKWIGPVVEIGSWRDENFMHLGDEYMDSSLPKLDACMISHALQINAAIAEELVVVCSPKQLQCDSLPKFQADKLNSEAKVKELESVLCGSGSQLNTLKMRKLRLMKNQTLTKDDDFTTSKFFNTISKDSITKKAKPAKTKPVFSKIKSPEAVLTIVIMRVDCPHPDTFRCKVSHEMEVLSGQKLSEFRDKFPCSLEKTCYGEFSARPDSHLRAPTYRYKFPSGCFFIEGIFYDDLREPGAVRLSDTIVRWASERDRGWSGFKQCETPMHLVSFEDLKVQLGKPYLLMHQGNCEHVWMVTSVRLHHPHDPQSMADYPRMTGISYFHKRKCHACTKYAASWMLVEDEYMPRRDYHKLIFELSSELTKRSFSSEPVNFLMKNIELLMFFSIFMALVFEVIQSLHFSRNFPFSKNLF